MLYQDYLMHMQYTSFEFGWLIRKENFRLELIYQLFFEGQTLITDRQFVAGSIKSTFKLETLNFEKQSKQVKRFLWLHICFVVDWEQKRLELIKAWVL